MAAPDISQWFPKLKNYGILGNQPSNINLAHSSNFRFIVDRIPYLTYFCVAATSPSIASRPREYPHMFGATQKFPGGGSEANLNIRFIIDEELKNYMEMVRWMRSGLPYRDFKNVTLESKAMPCDGRLFLLNNKKNPIKMITFAYMIPTQISGFTLTHTETEPSVLTCNATFVYDDYRVTDLEEDVSLD